MVKQVCETLERVLGYASFLEEDDGSGFNLKTTYQEETTKDANQAFEENYSFGGLQGGAHFDKIAPTKETKAEKQKRLEDKAGTLDKWYGMKRKTNLTADEKNQLVLLKLKDYLNPKQHFRTTDMKNIPKYFQVGTFIEGGDKNGFVGTKIPRGQRKSNLATELLEIDRKVQFTKKKFGELQSVKQRIAKNSKVKGSHHKLLKAKKHMKSLKKYKK